MIIRFALNYCPEVHQKHTVRMISNFLIRNVHDYVFTANYSMIIRFALNYCPEVHQIHIKRILSSFLIRNVHGAL